MALADNTLNENDRRVAEKLRREFGPTINKLLEESDVVEIMLNPDGKLWCERLGQKMQHVGIMDSHQAEAMMNTIASYHRLVITRESPRLSCELPFNGSRFQALIPPCCERPMFAIRLKPRTIFLLSSYVEQGMMSDAHRIAIQNAVVAKKNILVVGGTGSGKTTLTNAIIAYMSEACPDDRPVILEDTAELQCSSLNAVKLRSIATVPMSVLLEDTLRLRPCRIMVGEVRSGEVALTLVDSWNTGHPGGIATVHADDAAGGLVRIESLIRRCVVGVLPVKEIAAAINVVVCIAKTNAGRRVTEVVSIKGHSDGKYLSA